jgi:RNA polymerase sigma factor (TIGR02999 family)
MELVYGQLRGLARRYVHGKSPYEPMQPTELVHEAFIKLVDHDGEDWRGRSHFYAVAAMAMRQILVDTARKRLRDKRGGGELHLPLDEGQVLSIKRDEDVVAVDDVLSKLAAVHPEQAHLVELRFFGGMTMDEIAEATGTSKRTLHREWAVARAWLRRELGA